MYKIQNRLHKAHRRASCAPTGSGVAVTGCGEETAVKDPLFDPLGMDTEGN